MPKMIKKILTEDDLLKFCEEQKFTEFNSSLTGYQLAVQVPTTFEVDNNVDENHRGMMKLKFRIFHTGLNRNKSFVSEKAATKAMATIPDRPVLAAIHQLDDGTWDFEGHEMEIVQDENGNKETKYIESQVGSFSSEPAFWEHDDKLNKDYVCAYAYVSEEYTKACDIIRAKQGSKNSCELFIDEFVYNAKEKYLEFNDFYVNASTLLGSRADGTEIKEGMEGSRADIADFSVPNNSVKFNRDEKIIELLENLNTTLSNFNTKEQNSVQTSLEEGGNQNKMTKFEELLNKYNKTSEDITFEYENMSDEELEAKFEEIFGESADNKESKLASTSSTMESNNQTVELSKNELFNKLFEISFEDIRYALNALCSIYRNDSEWCYVSSVYDDYFIMQDWDSNKYYKQTYTRDGDNVAFSGERIEMFAMLLTESEKLSVEEMRANYSSVVKELNAYKDAEVYEDKMTVFEDENYTDYLETEEFKALMSKEFVDKYSKEELIEKADATFGKLIKKNKTQFNFSESNTSTTKLRRPKLRVGVMSDFESSENKDIYGDYFKSLDENK